MKKYLLFGLLAILTVFLTACEGVDLSGVSDADLNRISGAAVVCNEPYMRFGASCCLDQNNNNICDNDEGVDNDEPIRDEEPETGFEDPVLGRNSASTTIIWYGDYQDPFSKRFHDETLPQIRREYVNDGTVKIIFKDFPLSFHSEAEDASIAANCAGEQGRYWDMHDLLFDNQDDLGERLYNQLAIRLNLNTREFSSCLDSNVQEQEVEEDFREGTRSGVNGVPAFFVDGQLVSGAQPFSVFRDLIEPPVDEDELMDDDAVLGLRNAPVTIIEWSDYECPFCSRFHTQTWPQIKSQYIDTGKVKFVYRDFPLSFHPNAQKAAEAAECAGEQGQYWEMHDKLFEEGVAGGSDTFKDYAEDLDLNTARFDQCLDSGSMASEVRNDFSDGQEAGIQGTPGFLINGQLVSGAQPFEVFEQVIEAELN